MSASLCSASALVAPQTKAFTGLRSTPAVFARCGGLAGQHGELVQCGLLDAGQLAPEKRGPIPSLTTQRQCSSNPRSPLSVCPCSKPAGFAAVRRSVKPQRKAVSALQSTSSLVEFAQVANEAGFIGGVASTMVGMTLLVSAAEWWLDPGRRLGLQKGGVWPVGRRRRVL